MRSGKFEASQVHPELTIASRMGLGWKRTRSQSEEAYGPAIHST
jgi:hypothetical protein